MFKGFTESEWFLLCRVLENSCEERPILEGIIHRTLLEWTIDAEPEDDEHLAAMYQRYVKSTDEGEYGWVPADAASEVAAIRRLAVTTRYFSAAEQEEVLTVVFRFWELAESLPPRDRLAACGATLIQG